MDRNTKTLLSAYKEPLKMTPQEFVEALRIVVRDATVRNLPKVLACPPGRAPARELKEMSAWYLGLAAKDREMLHRVIAYSVDGTMFHVLCVLDGSDTIEDPGPERGELELDHVAPGGRTRLNDSSDGALHEFW